MTRPAQPFTSILRSSFGLRASALALLSALSMIPTQSALAQTYAILHSFTGGQDGQNPGAGLTVAGRGTLYGTASEGGKNGYGLVFKLAERGAGWVLNPLYPFAGGDDGAYPYGGVVVGPNGALYGTTAQGGSAGGGTAFELRPPGSPCMAVQCYWNETIIHSFTGNPDGTLPAQENLIFDQTGNIYGTTAFGGVNNDGVAFELAQSGGQWTENILHSFGVSDGVNPETGLIFDAAGNLYGTTLNGGTNQSGIAYQLTPLNGGWTEHTLVNFDPQVSGGKPFGMLIVDQSGNLLGTASTGGPRGGGTVFELTPSDGTFILSVPYGFSISGCNPHAGVTMDATGDLYGVCYQGGAYGVGMVFKLTNSSLGWVLTDLHDFDGNDGANPTGPVVLDAQGNLYGTTYQGGNTGGACGGGNSGCGVVWEITP